MCSGREPSRPSDVLRDVFVGQSLGLDGFEQAEPRGQLGDL
jgi:hypothetical protein